MQQQLCHTSPYMLRHNDEMLTTQAKLSAVAVHSLNVEGYLTLSETGCAASQ